MPDLRLSHSLEALFESEVCVEALTPNSLMDRLGGRGVYLMLIVLSLPFVVPLPLPPGFSSFVGPIIMLLAVRLALGLSPQLPSAIGNRSLAKLRMRKVFMASTRVLRWIERCSKPRGTAWMNWRAFQFANAMLVVFMAFLLALPFPPIVPLSNMLPSYSIIFLTASMLEGDGILIWLAYGLSLGTSIYLLSATGLMMKLALHWGHSILHFCLSMF